ncbi:hypothetical protein PQX77_006387 [Marasmius sp. AFHP31]|nr:hypothetical protein PQX77_006387 [Marasmius sp. AFHP31]
MESHSSPPPHYSAHITDPSTSRRRPPSRRMTEADDEFLVSWLAKNNPDGIGRRGQQVYEKLVAEHPIGTDICSSTWRERYIRNREYFDPLIRQYLIDNMQSDDAAGSSTKIPPAIQPFTSDDEALLVEYLANNAHPDGKGLTGRVYYQHLSANADGTCPGGTKHSWQTWRDHYVSNTERLNKLIESYRSAHGIRRSPRQSASRSVSGKSEQDLLFAGFLAEMKAEGVTAFGGTTVYQRLLDDENGKWPWGKQRSLHGWKSRYQAYKPMLEPMINAKLAEITLTTSLCPSSPSPPDSTTSPDSSESLEDNTVTPTQALEQNSRTPDPDDRSPSSSYPLILLSPKYTTDSDTPSSPRVESTTGLSLSRYSETRPDPDDPLSQAVAAVISQVPTYGLFTRQDDTVLLKYMVERSIQAKPGKKKRLGDIFDAIDVFQDLTKTVPAAGRHTAQAWRTRYMKHKLQFDRLVDSMKGPIERARRQASSRDSISDISYGTKRQIGDDDLIGRPKRAKTSGRGGNRKHTEESAETLAHHPIPGSSTKSDTEEEDEVAGYLCSMMDD